MDTQETEDAFTAAEPRSYAAVVKGQSERRSRFQRDGEHSPLLGQRSRSASTRSLKSNDGDSSEGEVPWFGTVELHGLPWWKRPSVRRPVFKNDLC